MISGGLFWALTGMAVCGWLGSRWGRARERVEADLRAEARKQRR
jgi:hypothetical protein